MKTTFRAILSASLLSTFVAVASAQTIFPVQISEICTNNPALRALRVRTDATMIDNLTGLNLPNPEVGVSYMWGQPSDVPNKTNIEVSQSFDFATLSGAKRKVAIAENAIAETEYVSSRRELMFEAEKTLIDYTYTSMLCAELENQVRAVATLDSSAQVALEKGTMNIIDRNKISHELNARRSELDLANIEREYNLNRLTQLNGGIPLTNLPIAWSDAPLPESFEQWAKQSADSDSEIARLAAQLTKSEKEIALRKSEGLPEFSIGYANELVHDSNYHGFTVGVTIPIWGNTGRVKAAKTSQAAATIELQAAYDEFMLRKRTQYNRAVTLRKVMTQYGEFSATTQANTNRYLDKALQQGSMSIFEYMTEKEDTYSHNIKYIESQRDFQIARAELYAETL